jgi:hypothetical protein
MSNSKKHNFIRFDIFDDDTLPKIFINFEKIFKDV